MSETAQSRYTHDGSFEPELAAATTVGELRELLEALPPELPLHGDGYIPTWIDVGQENESLAFFDVDPDAEEDDDEANDDEYFYSNFEDPVVSDNDDDDLY